MSKPASEAETPAPETDSALPVSDSYDVGAKGRVVETVCSESEKLLKTKYQRASCPLTRAAPDPACAVVRS